MGGSSKLAGALAKGVRACALARGGQPCASCPRRLQASAQPCPLLDIEDASLGFRPALGPDSASAGAAVAAGQVVLHKRASGDAAPRTQSAPATRGWGAPSAGDAIRPRGAHAGSAQGLPARSSPSLRSAWGAPAAARTPQPAPPRLAGHGAAEQPVRPLSARAAPRHADEERGGIVIPSIAVAHIQSALRAARVAPAVVPLSSARGRELFSDALHAGRAEAYFALAEQRVAPQDAATAPAAALAVVLNALGHDPRRVWRAPWRWNTPAVLVAGGAPAAAAASPLLDLAALARMQGARARAVPADAHAPSAALEGQRQAPAQASGGCEALREHVARTCGDTQGDEYLLVVRGRGNGSGGGGGDSGSSVAAVAGFHAASDMVLLMELADAHGPLAWVPLHELHAAMLASAGGWLALSTHSALDHAPAAQRQHGEADAGLCPAVVRSWGAAEGALPRDAARGLAQGAPRAIPEAAMRRALALPGPSAPWRCQRRGASPSGGRTAGGGLARLHKHVQAPRAFAPVATAAA